MKILYISNIPAPYCVEYLNELGKHCEVHAVFEKDSFKHRDESWKKHNVQNFTLKILKGINFGNIYKLCFSVKKEIKQFRNEFVIIANPMTPTGTIAVNYCRKHHVKYALQSEGGFLGSGKGFKERVKRWIIKGADLYLTGMKPENDYFAYYGAPQDKVFHYPFASLYEKDLVNKGLSREEKAKIKEELGIPYQKMVLYVGRIISCKGIDVLIRSCQGLPSDIGVYLVGGAATEPYVALAKELGVENINYISHLQLDELKKYYFAADVFVLPTRKDTWGLVINEAMTYGLPVITTKNCVAGLQLIRDGENGYLIESEDYTKLRKMMLLLLDNDELRQKMSQNNIAVMKDYSYEKMADVIYNCICAENRSVDNR